MFISPDHPIFGLEKQMEEICRPFLQAHGLNYFRYLRVFKDGSIAGAMSNTNWFKHLFFQLDVTCLTSYKEEHFPQSSYWFLSDEELPWLLVKIAREDHQLHHGITFIRRSLNYYDMIAFAMPEERSNAASYYLNILSTLEQFISFFEKKYGDLLKIAISHSIQVPEINRDRNYNDLCLKSLKRIPIIGASGPTYITPQELACLQLWDQGTKGKDIAYRLDIAPKTVESYLTRIKLRSGFNNRSGLVEMIKFL